jgi:hypothetical protein
LLDKGLFLFYFDIVIFNPKYATKMKKTLIGKNSLLYFIFSLVIVVSLLSCRKNYDSQPVPNKLTDVTVLGSEKANPFSFATIKKALLKLSTEKVEGGIKSMSTTKALRTFDDIRPTHNYVRFAPENLEQLNQLVTAGFELFDVPLTYEVVEEGDYYQDPSIPVTEITFQYTLVPYGYPLPSNVPHVILDEIFLFNEEDGEYGQPDYWSVAIDGGNTGAMQSRANQSTASLSTIADYVEMYGDPVINATNYLISHQFNPMQVYQTASFLEGAIIGDPYFGRDPNSGRIEDGGGGGGGGGGSTSWPPGYPAGVLRVRNTEMPEIEEPVRRVTVKARKFLKLETKLTDNNGRFQMTKKFRNRVTIIVKFKNELATIRRIDNIWPHAFFNVFPVKHNLGRFGNDNMNNIQYTFANFGNGTTARQSVKVWAAATAMNALSDTYEFNRENGINSPPHLNIWLCRADPIGNSAPMLNYAANPLYGINGLSAVVVPVINDIITSLSQFLSTLGPYGIGVAALLEVHKAGLLLNLPDITLNYERRVNSTWVYTTLMHEFSHATHFWGMYEQNGREAGQYWANEIQYTVKHNGYGNRNDAGAERAGVIEAWGHFAGEFYLAQKYRRGIYTSNLRAELFARRSILRLDNHQFDPLNPMPPVEVVEEGTANERYRGWIPIGFLHDLNDNVELTPRHIDNISGYDVNRIFRSLQNLNNTADDLRTSLINNRPGGVTRGDVEGLARQFGY